MPTPPACASTPSPSAARPAPPTRRCSPTRRARHHIVEVAPRVMDALSPVRTPSGVVAIGARPRWTAEALLTPGPALVVVAAGVQDPGNVGAIIRAAEAGGATGVLVDTTSADPFGWKALRAAMGSSLRLPVGREADMAARLASWGTAGIALFSTDAHEGTISTRRRLPAPAPWSWARRRRAAVAARGRRCPCPHPDARAGRVAERRRGGGTGGLRRADSAGGHGERTVRRRERPAGGPGHGAAGRTHAPAVARQVAGRDELVGPGRPLRG